MTTNWTADSFATFAHSDETTPVPTPNDWQTDCELRQTEREMIREQKDPDGFAIFCLMVLSVGVITDMTTIILLRLLGVVNGLRRVRPCDTMTVRRMLDDMRSKIDDLPDSARKGRLDTLWDYNAGIFARDQGQYDLAAELQERSATKAKASGDMQGWAIGRFCAAVERVNQALYRGKGIKKALQRLRGDASKNLIRHIPPTSNEYHWVVLNAPMHRIMAHFWADTTYRGMYWDWQTLGHLEESQSNLAKAHARAIQIGRMIYMFMSTGGLDMTWPYIQPEDTVEHKASIMLVHARFTAIDTDGFSIYNKIIDLPEEGAQQVRAVAHRKSVSWAYLQIRS